MSAALSLLAPQGPTIDAFDPDKMLGQLVRDYEASEWASTDSREWAELCRDYYDGKQLKPEEMRVLRERRQPPIVNNKIAEKIDLLCGMERRGRSDPKAYPRTPVEESRADIATQCLRYVSDDQRFDVIRSSVYKNMLIEGYGGCEVIVEEKATPKSDYMQSSALAPPQPDYNVVINYLPWDRIFYDPHSQHPGFADARYLGVVIWMDRDEALDRWPGAEHIIGSTLDNSISNTYDDKPKLHWADMQRRRVRIVQMETKRGDEWWTATFTKGGFLDEPQPSVYVDRHGKGDGTIVLRSGFIDRDNNRYGVVARMLTLQDAINKRESKLLHAMNVNRVIMDEGAVEDVDAARREVAKPDGVVVLQNPNARFEVSKDSAEIQGHFELLQFSIAQMNAQGPNASMAGKDPREQSGRAILAQQAGGMVAAEPLADELRQWNHKVQEKVWMRIRQFWTGPKIIRVTDDDKSAKFIGLNKPVTLGEELSQMPPDQAQSVAQRLGLFGPSDPRLNTVIRVENDLDDLDVDITIEEGPDTPNLQYEQFDALMKLPPQILLQFPASLIIKMSSLRNKDELLKLLDAHQQQQAAAGAKQQAAQEAMQQAAVADKQAQAADRQANAISKLHGVAADHAQLTQPQTTLTMEHAPPGPPQAYPAQV